MSQEEHSDKRPIEISFPIEQVNEIAEKEGHAKRYYRPVYTMHKYWARRLGSVFRSILLYTLADEEMSVSGERQSTFENEKGLAEVDWENPDALWRYYLEDVSFDGKTVLDPFMGGGTTIVEALRMGCNVVGSDLNPVAWFIVKKEIEDVDLDRLRTYYNEISENVSDEIKSYYRTNCPECNEAAEAMYYFWVKKVECLNCGDDVSLFKSHYFADSRSSNDSYKNVICPECWTVQKADSSRESTQCENTECEINFTPNNGNASGQNYTCPHCGQKSKIIDSTQRFGKPDAEIYAIEYNCQSCNSKGYKQPEDDDLTLYQEASEELEDLWNELPIPQQRRYRGSFDHATDHGYKTHSDMFNDRQLLCLGKLLNEIKQVDDQNISEFLLLAFSACLESNNMFCMYNKKRNHIEPIFNNSLITVRHTPIEGNVWGAEYGRGTFQKMFEKLVAGKEWCKSPVEKYVDAEGETQEKQLKTPIKGELANSFEELGDNANALLRCGTSEYIPIPDKSVDFIVTDPPYYDNEMYAEQTDFYYVWLKEMLEDDYEQFASELTPKSNEAVVDRANNEERNRTRDEYIDTLTSIFSESRSKLSDDGLMVFTFHHKETEAWSSTLQAVLDANFYISALYPIDSETSGGTRHGRATVDYDTIIVCRKRKDDAEDVAWRSLEDQIYFRAEEEIERLEQRGRRLSGGDVFVVAMGKCLEEFSKHYPNVTRDGEPVSVVEAVDSIQDIVDEQLMEERVQTMSDEMDTLSAVYLTYVLGRGGTISYNALNKDLRQRGVDVSELVHEGLLEQEGDRLNVLGPLSRADSIETKQNSLAVDRAHYLRYLYETDQLAQRFGQWADEGSIAALRRLAEIENDDEYTDIADYVEERTDTQLDLEDFS